MPYMVHPHFLLALALMILAGGTILLLEHSIASYVVSCGAAVLILALYLEAGAPGLDAMQDRSVLGTLVSGFGGALAGALAAYQFQIRRDRSEERRRRVADGTSALAVLLEQRAILYGLERQHLRAVAAEGDNAWTVAAALGVVRRPSLNIESLYFLLEGSHADLVHYLSVGDGHFHELLSVMDQRALEQRQLQRKVAAFHQQWGLVPVDRVEVELIAGPETTQALKDLTRGMFEAFCVARRSNYRFEKMLRYALKDTFKGHHFWNYEKGPVYPPRHVLTELDLGPFDD
ncbi:hypothetical protein KF840_20270 [bacterium]|nr:hypothetical protein [bacterium]